MKSHGVLTSGRVASLSRMMDGWISLEMIYGLLTCKVPTQAVCKWLKYSDVKESFFFFLFGPIQWTDSQNWSEWFGPSASWVNDLPNPEPWLSLTYWCFYSWHIFTVYNISTTSSMLILRSVRIQFVFFEYDRVAVIRVNYSFNRTVWFEHVRFVKSRNPMSVLIGWDDFGGNPEFDWLGESKLL